MRRSWWFFVLILLIAFGLRLYRLSAQSLWIDELVTAHYIYNVKLNTAIIEPYSLVYIWFVAPSALLIRSEFGLRFPFVLAGMLSTALVYQIGKQYHSQRAGWIAALFFAILPIAIYFAQEARLYGIVIMGALLTLWCIPLAERGVGWAKIAYPISLAFTAAVHLMTLPWLLTQVGVLGLRQLITGRGIGWRGIFTAFFAVIAGNAAIILIGLARGFVAGTGAEYLVVPDIPDTLVNFVLNSFGMSMLDVTESSFQAFFALAVLLITLILVEIVRFVRRPSLSKRGQWPDGWAVVMMSLLVILPITAGYVFSFLVSPVWQLRYFVSSVISVGLLIAIVLASLPIRALRIGLTAALVACALIVLRGYYTDPRYQREDWRGAVAFLEEHASPDDALIPYRASYGMAQSFYQKDALLTWDVSAPVPTQPEFEQHLREVLSEDPTHIWIITRTTETEVGADGWLVSPALDALAERVAIHRFQRVYIYEYEAIASN